MIAAGSLRLGNLVLYKTGNKVSVAKCSWLHFEALAKGESQSFYPVVLKADILEKSGFTENRDYPLLPQAREFILPVAVATDARTEIVAYIKSNGECFARAVVNGAAASNAIYHLHSLQNLYFAITGEEADIKL
jgi:hypothetical protein